MWCCVVEAGLSVVGWLNFLGFGGGFLRELDCLGNGLPHFGLLLPFGRV